MLFDIDGTLVDTGGKGMTALRKTAIEIFGNEGPPLEDIVPLGCFMNLGGWVREVIDDKLGGPIKPGLLLVRCDHGLSLIARLASLTVLCKGFMSCFTSKLKSLWSFPC